MSSYTSDWNKETVMANATRLLHITQELAVDSVPKYTKKSYAQLGFGSSSIAVLQESEEVSLVQEAYEIAWKYFNLTLQYVPIARTRVRLHTHHGLLGDFIGNIVQDNRVLIGDNSGVYTCSLTGEITSRWHAPRTERVSRQPNSTEAYTGRVLTGTRTCTIESGFAKDLNSMTDVERVSATEPITIKLSASRWFLTWYPKQKYMMIQKSEDSEEYCGHPSEVTWSYRVAPSSYRQYVYHNDIDNVQSTKSLTLDFKNEFPMERHQTDYSYEVPNALDGFDWFNVDGSLPVYKCPPMLVKYFNDSFTDVRFEGDSSLDVNNIYTEILESIEDPKAVDGYVIWESHVKRDEMYYMQLEFFSVPLDKLFPVRNNTFYSIDFKVLKKPRQHSSGTNLAHSVNAPLWVYYKADEPDAPDVTIKSTRPRPTITVGTALYKLLGNVEPARNAAGLAMYTYFGSYMSESEGYFKDSDTFDFREFSIHVLGVRYDEEGIAYAICAQESYCLRAWTLWTNVPAPKVTYPPKTTVLTENVTGLDWKPLEKLLKYEVHYTVLGTVTPILKLRNYRFTVQLARRFKSGSDYTSGKATYSVRFLPDYTSEEIRAKPRFWAYSHESEQYSTMLTTSTGQYGFYSTPVPSDTLKLHE